ncbi:unnamed protein product [Periconia digitata]|uniref:Uncharacterized protein n=1 Tax=Periconia digitata TaxID=1303443 RepID=A0A9W4XM64_9PLEO|nr:unnamed protein product [Periconia digitata]
MLLSLRNIVSIMSLALSSGAFSQMSTTSPASSWPTSPAPTHAPIPIASVIPLPSEYSHIAKQIVACWDSSIYYSFTSSFLDAQISSGRAHLSSTYPTPITETPTRVVAYGTCSTDFTSLTTLCDGYPRASTCNTQCWFTRTATETDTFTRYGTESWITPSWSTELERIVAPTCTVAADLSPQCADLAEAYSWRVSRTNYSSTAMQNAYISPFPPGCKVLVKPTNQPTPSRPKCSFKHSKYSAWFWPTPSPTESGAFCSPAAITPPSPPPTPLNTAVISGLEVTSPYLYQFIENVTIYTYRGQASPIGSHTTGDPVYGVSTSLPQVTYSVLPESILSQKSSCLKSVSGGPQCTVSFHPDFVLQDLFTVNATRYFKTLPTPTTASAVCQNWYGGRIGIPLTDVAAQNGVGENCQWTAEYTRYGTTTTVIPQDVSLADAAGYQYKPILVTTRGGMRTEVAIKSETRARVTSGPVPTGSR